MLSNLIPQVLPFEEFDGKDMVIWGDTSRLAPESGQPGDIAGDDCSAHVQPKVMTGHKMPATCPRHNGDACQVDYWDWSTRNISL